MRLFSRVISGSATCFLLITTAFAQPITKIPDDSRASLGSAGIDAARFDLEQRSALAEKLVAAKELPGREFPADFRAAIIEGLKHESYDQLRERLGTGNIASQALGDTKADLVYTTFQQPCRIIDTRLGGGIIASMQVREFDVVALPSEGLAFQGGNPYGCGIPSGATVVQINFVAVGPVGAGNLKGSAYPSNPPAIGSILNYQLLTPGLNVANGLLFPICDPTTAAECHVDIKLQANGAATHVVADVLGYAMRFPKENVKDALTWHSDSTNTTVGTACTNVVASNGVPFSLPFTAPATGKVRVRGNVKLLINHFQQPPPLENAGSVYRVTLSDLTTDCSGFITRDQMDFESSALVSGVPTTVDLPLDAVFSIAKDATINFRVNGISDPWYPFDSATITFVGLVAEFIPD